MIKILCNICEKDISQEVGFRCETNVEEIVDSMLTKTPQKQVKQNVYHVCRDCYNLELRDIYERKQSPISPKKN